MKKYIYIIVLFLGLATEGITQCSCTMLLTQDLTIQDSCCYYITADINGGTSCNGVTFGNININTASNAFNPCEILSITGLNGHFGGTTGNNTNAEVKPLSGSWNLSGPTNVAEICFTNGIQPLSFVLLDWEGYNTNGVLATNCPDGYEVKTCPSNPPLDCSCSIDYQSTNNNDCCYEITVEFMGADCPVLDFTSVEFYSNIIPAYSCEIKQIIAYPGYSTSTITNNNSGSITSLTNMANTNGPHLIGQICFENGNSPISSVQAYMTDYSGNSMISCEGNMEVDASCSPPLPRMPFDKIVGDQDDNIPVKVIYAGPNKMIVLGNLTRGGIDHGTVFQYDLTTKLMDFQTLGPDNTYFSDIAYHPGTGESYIVGYTSPIHNGTNSVDNKSFIIKITDDGTCDKVEYYDQVGRETFRKIIYQPDGNGTGAKFYVVGAKNNSLPATHYDDLILFKMDENCVLDWYRKINHTGDDEMYRGIFPRLNGDGVMIVGNDSNNNRGAFVGVDANGNLTEKGILDNSIDLYDGHIFPNLDKLLIGTDFGAGYAIITLWDANNNLLDAIKMPDLNTFQELITNSGSSRPYFYTVAQSKNAPNENIIVRFKVSGGQIFIDGRFSVENGENDFKLGTINWHKDAQYILYADGRIPLSGPGGYDTYFAAYDELFTSSKCIKKPPLNNQPYMVNYVLPNITLSTQNLPAPTGGQICEPLDYECDGYCSPPTICNAKFTWEQKDCHKVQFTDVSTSGTGTITSWNWNFTGTAGQATTQHPIYDFGMPGTYSVCLDITTSDGCSDQYCETVTVVQETEPPTIVCNGDVFVGVQACDRGRTVTFTTPMANDLCGNVTVACDHQSGDFFPCGNTTVTCIATDDYGNTATCSFIIHVTCECAVTEEANLACSEIADQFYFDFIIEDISGAVSCTANISLSPTIGNINVINQYWTGNKLYANGTIDAIAYPFPTSFAVQVDLTCVCPDQQPHTCTHTVYFKTPCCDTASIADGLLCKVADEHLINIDFFGTVNDIVQIDYYVQDAPCPSTYWGGTPYQTSIGYQPLRILPRFHTADICVYAKIYLGNNEDPCDSLITNIASYILCAPYDCNLNDQAFCNDGSLIQPAPIVFSGTLPDCDYTIEWYDYKNRIQLLQTSTTFTPNKIRFTAPQGDCYQDFVYEMRIIGACGPLSCFSTIRLWNSNADVGDLYLDPIENLPLCYGEDVSIRYDKECVDPTKKWKWSESLDGSIYTPIPGSGDGNSYYNSNKLFQDHWYQVKRKNGLCKEQTVEIHIPVKDQFTLSGFTAFPYNACRDNGLKLNVNGSPCIPSTNAVCDCSFTIDWYKNGLLISSQQSATTSSGLSYIDPALNGNYSGIYYAVVTDNCCGQTERSNTIYIKPPIKLGIVGPCYICVPGTTITLTGLVKNGPADGPCTYQWYYDGGTTGYQIWGGGTGISINTTKPGKYKLEMTCTKGSTTCIKIAEFEVLDCYPVAVNDYKIDNFDFTIAPNPSYETTTILIEGEIKQGYQLSIFDHIGHKIQQYSLDINQDNIQIKDLLPGIYMIVVQTDKQQTMTKKLIML